MENRNLILRPKKSKIILFLTGSVAFTAAGFLVLEENEFMGWMSIIFFGLCSITFLIQLIPGSFQLLLTKEGFTITSFFRSHFTYWKEVESFNLGYVGRDLTVMFDYVDSHKDHAFGKYISKEISDSHGALPDTYGMQATELLALLEEFKQTYAPLDQPEL
ncbi:hypothetical protein JAO76_15520 [Pontibacter sp. BT310]|uniref:Uncharacterized protein n=1 Tax=Pontibacter populi TaxID=890055 RepID=A0ABS6XEQ3_9BACT|nr:STM3941 family protein [Pontibacter populi]MBJ6119619.1 hypothetical protein [Pontibacter sp. BT310]MBR0572046.1 hypothetical protein [Microvirga sp. STS03]MBW3366472.1 hypothetical protein [Pontibacter populi]